MYLKKIPAQGAIGETRDSKKKPPYFQSLLAHSLQFTGGKGKIFITL